MSIGFKLDRKKIIRYMVIMIFAIVLFNVVNFHIGMLLGFAGVYLFLLSMEVTMKTKRKHPWMWTLVLFMVQAILTVYCIQYLLLEPDLFAKLKEIKWYLNILCVIAINFILLIFMKKPEITTVITHTGLTILSFVNYYVYLFRENEFIFPDLRSVGTGLSVAGNYTIELSDKGCYVIFGVLLYYALVRKFRVTFEKKWRMRLISVGAVLLITSVIAVQTAETNTETWEKKGSYRNGYILNFILSARDSFVSAPEGYTAELIQKLEKSYEGVHTNDIGVSTEKAPTIIVVMSESFADLSVLGELETNEPLTPFIDSLQENTTKGYALSPVFGAKTSNCEWEFMTGNSMAFLPVGSVVYQQYISETPTSIVSSMKNLGYTCISMHPYYNTGWSRHLIYPTMGFDEIYFLEDFDQTQMIRRYISDREHYRKIIERYENRTANESLFFMTITMQNHGGFKETYENFPENYYKLGRSYPDVNQYLSLVKETDNATEEFINYFANQEDPVMVVFFGDHQPSLNSQFYKLMNGKGMSGLTLEELEDLYTVPFFIWTNYDTPEETVEMTSLNYLVSMALERSGLEIPAYNQFLLDMMKVVPAINSQAYYSLEAGTYKYLDEATGKEKEWITNYQMLQYNNMFDNKLQSKVFFPYLK